MGCGNSLPCTWGAALPLQLCTGQSCTVGCGVFSKPRGQQIGVASIARQVFLDDDWATKIEAGPFLLAQKWRKFETEKSRTSIWQLDLLRLRFVFVLFNAKQEPGYVLGCFLHWPNKEGVHVFLLLLRTFRLLKKRFFSFRRISSLYWEGLRKLKGQSLCRCCL